MGKRVAECGGAALIVDYGEEQGEVLERGLEEQVEEDDEMSFMNSERNMSNDSISVEIDTFVRKSNINSSDEVSKEDQIFYDLLDLTDINKTDVVTMKDSEDLGLELTWWHVLILSIACLLFTCLCCYVTSCCYLTLDCCSDQYWGCCSCCVRFVKPTKPPPHVKLVSKTKTHDATVNNSKYSLNENSTAPRTRGSSKSLTNSNRGSNKVCPILTPNTIKFIIIHFEISKALKLSSFIVPYKSPLIGI